MRDTIRGVEGKGKNKWKRKSEGRTGTRGKSRKRGREDREKCDSNIYYCTLFSHGRNGQRRVY
jgi:hypothetical protein